MSLDPVILFFLLGLLAGLVRAELRLPAAIYDFLSMLLLLTIGLKGGVELAKSDVGLLLPQLFGGTGDATEFGHLPKVVKLLVVEHQSSVCNEHFTNYIRLFLMKNPC